MRRLFVLAAQVLASCSSQAAQPQEPATCAPAEKPRFPLSVADDDPDKTTTTDWSREISEARYELDNYRFCWEGVASDLAVLGATAETATAHANSRCSQELMMAQVYKDSADGVFHELYGGPNEREDRQTGPTWTKLREDLSLRADAFVLCQRNRVAKSPGKAS